MQDKRSLIYSTWGTTGVNPWGSIQDRLIDYYLRKNYGNKLFLDPERDHDSYNEVFMANPEITGIFFNSSQNLQEHNLTLDSVRRTFPQYPILILDNWTMYEPFEERFDSWQ